MASARARGRPLSTSNHFNRRFSDELCSGTVLSLDRVMRDISFLRVHIDTVTIGPHSEQLNRQMQAGVISGFMLEYSIPCPNHTTPSLAARVRYPTHRFSSTDVKFNYKRVALIKMTPELVSHWHRSSITLSLSVQLNAMGKFTHRSLGRATVPLCDLLEPPFLISRHFDFVGVVGADASAMVRIDLGSRVQAVQERLDGARGEGLERTLTVGEGRGMPFRARSRSESRCHDRARNASKSRASSRGRARSDSDEPMERMEYRHAPIETGILHPQPAPVPRRADSVADSSDSVFYPDRDRHSDVVEVSAGMRSVGPASAASVRSSVRGESRERPARAITVRLALHAASGLPVMTKAGRPCLPSAFVSVRGRDGELRSPVAHQTRNPRWEWICQFTVSSERKNLVVKLLHRDEMEGDKPLGFVSLSLPLQPSSFVDFEMVDLTSSSCMEIPLIQMSASQTVSRPPSVVELCPSAGSRLSAREVEQMEQEKEEWERRRREEEERSRRRKSRTPSPPILESREELERRLRRNMSDLDELMKGIRG